MGKISILFSKSEYPTYLQTTHILFSVESVPGQGNSFTNTHPDWKEGIFDKFNEWASKQFGLKEMDSDDDAEVPVDKQKAKDIEFEKDESGVLILPPMDEYNTVRQRQRVVRGYIGAVYSRFFFLFFFISFIILIEMIGEFTGYRSSAFPFSLAEKEGQTIYSPKCAPDGFILKDPDHLKGKDIDGLYIHWERRQRKGREPFIIKNSKPGHRAKAKKSLKGKGKQKEDWVNVSTDEEKEERGKEKSEGEESDEENGNGLDVEMMKFGPPKGGKKKVVQFSPRDNHSSPVAGPSTSKYNHRKTPDSILEDPDISNTEPRKRNTEEELDGPPKKLRKVDGRKKGKPSTPIPQTENEGPGKRKRDVKQELEDIPVPQKKSKPS